jgi:siroheme synthase
VPCEIVPGVSAAVAAPALSGIPVTHRGLASAFVVVSGHAEEAYAPVLASLAPGSATLVLLMGIATRAATAALLVARGWPKNTPAAILFSASRPDAFTWRGTLGGIAGAPTTGAPGVIVIGATVALADRLQTADAGGQRAAAR